MSNKPQSQASLIDQLRALIPLANKAGLYDAADFLRAKVESQGAREEAVCKVAVRLNGDRWFDLDLPADASREDVRRAVDARLSTNSHGPYQNRGYVLEIGSYCDLPGYTWDVDLVKRFAD